MSRGFLLKFVRANPPQPTTDAPKWSDRQFRPISCFQVENWPFAHQKVSKPPATDIFARPGPKGEERGLTASEGKADAVERGVNARL